MATDASPLSHSAPSVERYRAPIESLLKQIIRDGYFQLSFTLRSCEAASGQLEAPELVVDFSGPDSDLLLDAHGELLNALEYVVLRAVRVDEALFPKIAFDCDDWRRLHVEELQLTAQAAADRVRDTGAPLSLGAMTSRERRIIHLALRDRPEVRTESQGYGAERKVVIHPASSPSRR